MASRIARLVISWKTMRLSGRREPQHFGQVPCDGFSFAVFIGRQPYGLALGKFGQFVHHFLLVARDFIDGLELVVDIDAQVFFRQVADVSETRLDDIVLAEELLDGFGPWRGTRRLLNFPACVLYGFSEMRKPKHEYLGFAIPCC